MLVKTIDDFNNLIKSTEEPSFQASFYKESLSKPFIVLLPRMLSKMLSNLKSMDSLLAIDEVEDAYTIFRKMLETFFLVESVLVNPQIARTYIIHEDKLSKKVMNNYRTDEVKAFIEGKPDGYLEYGFVEQLVDTSEEGFKYTIKTVANAAGVGDLYKWYRITSNFVHNNLTQFKINKPDLSAKLITMCDTVTNKLLETINNY